MSRIPPPSRIVVATGNPGKLREIARLLAPWAIEPLAKSAFPGAPEVREETGPAATFRGNAYRKARALFDFTGLPSLADDSGLCVDALGGAPGVDSAYFAGPQADDEANNLKLRDVLAGIVEPAQRGCHYVCVVALVMGPHPEDTLWGEGRVDGQVAFEPRGDGGFGYDPWFILPDRRTMAQLPLDEKNRLSHRAKAIADLARAFAAPPSADLPNPPLSS